MSNFQTLSGISFVDSGLQHSLWDETEILSFHAMLSAVGIPRGSPIEHSKVQKPAWRCIKKPVSK